MKIILIISGVLAILQTILFWGKEAGISVFIFVIACLLYLMYILNKNKKIVNKKALIYILPIILLSSTYFIFNNTFFRIINIFIIAVLGMIMITSLCKIKIKNLEFLRKMSYVFGGMFESVSDVIDYLKIPEEKKNNNLIEKTKKFVKAILITIPIIIVVLFLLMSADQIFEEIFDKIFLDFSEILSLEGIIKVLSRLSIILITFLLCGGFIVNLVKENTMFNKEDEEIKIIWKFENLTINMILTILNIIYLIFSFIQITNLFIDTSNNPNFDYSNYARQGFFQLMFVSFINFVILIIANINNKEKTKGQKIYIKAMNLLIIIFTIIIIISALYRMNLYQETYGYTYLRIFVDFILITEILISIPITIKILGIKIDVLKTSIVIISFMYVILNFINIDNFIAKKNIDRYFENPENGNFDMNYLCTLGTDATKEIMRLLDSQEEKIVERTKYYLYNQKQKLNFEEIEWQEYNISKEKATEILNTQKIEINNN